MASNKIITDKQIIDAAKATFGIDIAKDEDETIEINIHFGTLTLNKSLYERNKKFYEERKKKIQNIINKLC